VRSKRDRRRMILADVPDAPHAPAPLKPIGFGSPRHPADRCSLYNTPAEFAVCLDCRYNKGAQGSGILCAHRFGIDPTLIDGVLTQFKDGEIVPLDDES
jgi:hypothetical protein